MARLFLKEKPKVINHIKNEKYINISERGKSVHAIKLNPFNCEYDKTYENYSFIIKHEKKPYNHYEIELETPWRTIWLVYSIYEKPISNELHNDDDKNTYVDSDKMYISYAGDKAINITYELCNQIIKMVKVKKKMVECADINGKVYVEEEVTYIYPKIKDVMKKLKKYAKIDKPKGLISRYLNTKDDEKHLFVK